MFGPQRVVTVAGGEIVKNGPLGGGHDAAGDTAADHHDILLAGLAQVAVVLLVGTVKFQEFIIVVRKMIHGFIGDGHGDGAGDGRDRGLNFFVVR